MAKILVRIQNRGGNTHIEGEIQDVLTVLKELEYISGDREIHTITFTGGVKTATDTKPTGHTGINPEHLADIEQYLEGLEECPECGGNHKEHGTQT